jgi:hypothetical protein
MSTKPFRWFVFYVSSNLHEHKFFLNKIVPFFEKLTSNDIDNVEMDMIYMGNKKNASEFIEYRTIKIRKSLPIFKEKILETKTPLVKLTKKLKKDYHGIMLCSHSNGVTIASDKNIIIEVADFIDICKKNIIALNKKVNFFVCDCCYMGSLASLYQMSFISDHILATSSYHDGKYSFVQCYDVYKYHDDNVIWLSKFSNWYLNISHPYAGKLDYQIQWSIYSSIDIQELANYIIKNNLHKDLVFNKSSVIYWDDDNLHNFDIVIKNTMKKKPKLNKKLDKLLMLYLKSFVYYLNNNKCKCDVKFCPMSIHKELPEYLNNDINCRLEYFKKIHCNKML